MGFIWFILAVAGLIVFCEILIAWNARWERRNPHLVSNNAEQSEEFEFGGRPALFDADDDTSCGEIITSPSHHHD